MAVITRISPRLAGPRLIGFPYAGGGPSVFRSWTSSLPGSVELWAAHLGGREGRFHVPPTDDLRQQVHELATAILPLADRPLALYGHSLGASLAAHVAQQLCTDEGVSVELIVAAHSAPWADSATSDQADDLLSDLSLETVSRRLLRAGRIDEGLAASREWRELVSLMQPAMAADAALARSAPYLEPQVLSGPVHAVYGRDDRYATRAMVTPWCRLTRGSFFLREVPGGHFFVTEQYLLDEVVNPVMRSLAYTTVGTPGAASLTPRRRVS